jgi:hypothetical protein
MCEVSRSHGDEYEVTVFWDVAPCGLVDIARRLRGACYSYHLELTSLQYVKNMCCFISLTIDFHPVMFLSCRTSGVLVD